MTIPEGSNHRVGVTYSTRYGEVTILAFRPETYGVLLRMGGRQVLVGLTDFQLWNARPVGPDNNTAKP